MNREGTATAPRRRRLTDFARGTSGVIQRASNVVARFRDADAAVERCNERLNLAASIVLGRHAAALSSSELEFRCQTLCFEIG